MNEAFTQRVTRWLLAGAALITIAKLGMYVLYGYGERFLGILALLFCLVPARYAVLIACLIGSVVWFIRRQPKMLFTAAWILLAVLDPLLAAPLGTLGSLLPVLGTNPEVVLNDSRKLANQYGPLTCFGPKGRPPCDNPEPFEKIPVSIQELDPYHILILQDYILVEQQGLLGGVFRGFVAFRSEPDVWQHYPRISSVGCSTCWRIRISNGLYWFQDNVSDPFVRLPTPP